jgi:carbamoyl-phosphate synthase large subunit
MLKILITGGGGAGNEALYRLFQEKYEMHFGDADLLSIDPSIPEKRRHKLPLASDDGFLNYMIDLCSSLNIDLLIPSVDEELHLLALNRRLLQPTRLLLPSVEYISQMIDKYSMIQSLESKGIPTPFSQKLSEDIDNFIFPCIVKPRNGRGSRDVRIVTSKNEALSIQAGKGENANQSILQEKIEGIEFTVQMVANTAAKLEAIVPVEVAIKRGVTLRAKTSKNEIVIDACQKIHNAFPAAGCYNIQLILDDDGRVFPFEINPRISTTLCLVVAAGVDPIAVYMGQAECGQINFENKIQLKRHWANYFTKEE